MTDPVRHLCCQLGVMVTAGSGHLPQRARHRVPGYASRNVAAPTARHSRRADWQARRVGPGSASACVRCPLGSRRSRAASRRSQSGVDLNRCPPHPSQFASQPIRPDRESLSHPSVERMRGTHKGKSTKGRWTLGSDNSKRSPETLTTPSMERSSVTHMDSVQDPCR